MHYPIRGHNESGGATSGDKIYYFFITGDLNYSNYEKIALPIENMICRGKKKIIIDPAGLNNTDSAGTGIHVKPRKPIRQADGEIIITGCR